MANQTTSAWRDPALRDFAEQEVKKGRTYAQIAEDATAKYDVKVTSDSVRNHLARRKLNMAAFLPSVAGIPRNLIEPREGFAKNYEAPKPRHEKGWEPHLTIEGPKATGVVALEQANADHEMIIRGYKLDPKLWRIVGGLECRRWDTSVPVEEDSSDCRCDEKQSVRHHESRTLFYYKARLEEVDVVAEAVVAELQHEIRRWRPVKYVPPTGDLAYVVNIADTQMGKALDDDTPILTTDGWMRHGDIRPGMFVFGPDGQAKCVLSVTGSTPQECFRVSFDRGAEVVASKDHLWEGRRTVKGSDDIYRTETYMMTTAELNDMRRIASRKGTEGFKFPFSVRGAEPVQLAEQDLPIDPYILGIWLGDGNRNSGWITVGAQDREHFEPYGYYMPHDNHGCSSLRIPGLTQQLAALDLIKNKHVPEKYLLGSYDQRLALLQGLMDTDGHCVKAGFAEFCNTNKNLSDAVKWLATSIGCKVTFKEKIPRLNGVEHAKAYIVRFWQDASIPVFRIPRKQARLVSIKESSRARWRYVRRVEPVGLRSAQCLTVEGGLYLAGRDLVTTHNCDGDGSKGIVQRFLEGIESVSARAKLLRKMGVKLGPLYVFGLGDLVEGCDGQYATQTFTVELTRRQQVTVMRRLITRALQEWSQLFEQVVVAAVGGNHGENRKDGRAFTDASDNDDVAVFEQVEEVLSANPAAFGHVAFRIPHKELSMTLDVCGTITGITHGHLGGRGKTASMKAHDWWMQQAHGMRAIGDAQLLITGHYHFLSVYHAGAKTHIQVPALDGGSEWWTNMTGQHSPPGMSSLVVGSAAGPSGWDHLRVHSETQRTFIRSPEAQAETLRALEVAIAGKSALLAA